MKKWLSKIIFFMAFIFVFSVPLCAAGIGAELEKARQYFEKGDYETTIKICAGALKDEPDNQELVGLINQARGLLEEQKKRLQEEKTEQKNALLNSQAQACYDKGELDEAIKIWSQILKDDPNNDEAVWMIQKAQAREQIEERGAKGVNLKERNYSEKIKNIADDIAKLIEQAKGKMEEEKERRRQEELAALAAQAKEEEKALLEEKQRGQQKEELFISDTFKRGQEFYAQGKYNEALREWNSILPLLSRDNQLRATVESLSSKVEQKIKTGTAGALPLAATGEAVPAGAGTVDKQPQEEALTIPKEGANVGVKKGGRFNAVTAICIFLAFGLALIFLIGVLRANKVKIAFRQSKMGKGFDPGRLRDFVEAKRKAAGAQDKDIFKSE